MNDKVLDRLTEMGLKLPAPMVLPPGLVLPFSWCKVLGRRVLVSGHLPLAADGSIWSVTGKVGAEVSVEQANLAARQATLAMLATLHRELGSLERISNWGRVFGMVNTAPGFNQTVAVINGCSDLLISVFGRDIGSHTRSAVGFAELPANVPVELEAEIEIH